MGRRIIYPPRIHDIVKPIAVHRAAIVGRFQLSRVKHKPWKEEGFNILWRGARGPAAKELQSCLKELGFDPGNIDGIFGLSTAAAITAFQWNRKLFSDSIADLQTLSALKLPTPPLGAPKPARTKVFVSYSHADEKWLKMLQVHVAPLERNGIVVLWIYTKIVGLRNFQ